MKKTKVAIVYDWIDSWGGVERVLLVLANIFPRANFYTSIYDPVKAAWAKKLSPKTSFIQKLPSFIRRSRILSLPFYPLAFESFDFRTYDLVISVSSSFAKGVITHPRTRHLAYVLTPPRFLWGMTNQYISGSLIKGLSRPYLSYLKKWDFIAAQRPDEIIAISQNVASRCLTYYNRQAAVLYPPFDADYWEGFNHVTCNLKQVPKKYYLIVSRLTQYKRVELAVQVFNDLPNDNLIIVGKGRQKDYLRRRAGRNIYFKNDLSDRELSCIYRHAEAHIMPQEEDFGYTALEAQYFGCPVLAYAKGGAKETVIEGKTGLFFAEQTKSSLLEALERFKQISYNLRAETRKNGKINSDVFDKKKFIEFFQSL